MQNKKQSAMESTDFYTLSSPSLSHLMESEEDFPFGAKTTSFLPPATVTNAAASTTTITYDLPEWMESREIFGLPNVFEDLPLPFHTSTSQGGSLLKLKDEDYSSAMKLEEEEYCSTIKPEDMLVPLSELQPPHTPASPPLASTPPVSPAHVPASPVNLPCVPATPPPAPATPGPADPPLPKIIICRKVTTSAMKSKPIQVHYQVMPVKQVAQVTSSPPLLLHTTPQIPSMSSGKSREGQVAVIHLEGSHGEPQISDMALAMPQNAPGTQVPQVCDAEELINEMMQMIGNTSSSGGFQDLENVAFDSSVMDNLLSQLEASDPDNNTMDSEPHSPSSPASLSASVPSESPFSISLPSESPSSTSVPSPHPPESPFSTSPVSFPSPVPSVGSLSPAQSSSDSLFPCGEASPDGECLEKWSPLEETHSYSRSQRKARSSHRTPATRKAPYLEDRKERKKEQNKQAALRYRQKRKQEEDDLMGKVEVEMERQQKLKSKYSGLKQELSYLKKIMREVFIARGILSEEALKKAALEKKE